MMLKTNYWLGKPKYRGYITHFRCFIEHLNDAIKTKIKILLTPHGKSIWQEIWAFPRFKYLLGNVTSDSSRKRRQTSEYASCKSYNVGLRNGKHYSIKSSLVNVKTSKMGAMSFGPKIRIHQILTRVCLRFVCLFIFFVSHCFL